MDTKTIIGLCVLLIPVLIYGLGWVIGTIVAMCALFGRGILWCIAWKLLGIAWICVVAYLILT